jgi:acetyl esterase
VCAILARDAGTPKLVMQLLVYPRTAPDEELPSHYEFAEGHLLTRKTILWFRRHYRSSDADRQDFRYAPLVCEDLSGLPPALIIVGECDPLRDDGIEYAERLRREQCGGTDKLRRHDPPVLVDGWGRGCGATRTRAGSDRGKTSV